jgi:hypothetical protein
VDDREVVAVVIEIEASAGTVTESVVVPEAAN